MYKQNKVASVNITQYSILPTFHYSQGHFIRLRRIPRPWPWGNALMRDIPFQRSIYHASADFAHRRMTHRSLGACAPKRFSAQGRRWVWFWGTTGLPVGLHMNSLRQIYYDLFSKFYDGMQRSFLLKKDQYLEKVLRT